MSGNIAKREMGVNMLVELTSLSNKKKWISGKVVFVIKVRWLRRIDPESVIHESGNGALVIAWGWDWTFLFSLQTKNLSGGSIIKNIIHRCPCWPISFASDIPSPTLSPIHTHDITSTRDIGPENWIRPTKKFQPVDWRWYCIKIHHWVLSHQLLISTCTVMNNF